MASHGTNDTIFATASGLGRAAVCVVRVSGDRSRLILDRVAGGAPEPRRLALRVLRDPESAEALDQALVAWFPGPWSFTGEDQAELHIHGGLATRAAVLRVLAAVPGCRPAEAGEFTRRAFLNGRLDLSRVEGLADLIEAETQAQRRQALQQLEGRLGRAVERWRETLLESLALFEAALDFADEGDVPENLETQALGGLDRIAQEIAAALAETGGERLREGFTVVLAGPPNAGKSTLLNALAKRDVAIVSPVPGTTRDAIEVHCEVQGLPVIVIDTAGLRDSDDPVERIGIERTRARAAAADLVLWLVPPEGSLESPPGGKNVLSVGTKGDLGATQVGVELRIAATTGQGLDALLDRLAAEASGRFGHGDAVITRERHRQALQRVRDSLGRAQALARAGGASELVAEDVRLAVRAIGEITGRVDVEDVLDRLFSAFCIGK
jgi:tRNA modification GTPase